MKACYAKCIALTEENGHTSVFSARNAKVKHEWIARIDAHALLALSLRRLAAKWRERHARARRLLAREPNESRVGAWSRGRVG